ncbi:DUF6476 family protein [Rubellimicrobium aerolatum]|uniref:DUF6476 family protein n=1 Tax=Rubellimicrobium aerolatum TaxID=490979 RepID=A0ABW0S8M9_9RHOB|nr:DUF6476 family protein [Rubellimicrobium aerolatum]MBP1804643.1 hypothetical protein [Rubellimicrobium aerolatum]
MDTAPEASLPPGLRALQRLVTALIVVMILGFLVLIGAFVMRLNREGPPLPDSLDLPEGARPTAFTQGGDWLAVVTADDRILIYDRLTGRLRQTLKVD